MCRWVASPLASNGVHGVWFWAGDHQTQRVILSAGAPKNFEFFFELLVGVGRGSGCRRDEGGEADVEDCPRGEGFLMGKRVRSSWLAKLTTNRSVPYRQRFVSPFFSSST